MIAGVGDGCTDRPHRRRCFEGMIKKKEGTNQSVVGGQWTKSGIGFPVFFLNFGKGRLGFRVIGNVFDMDLLYLKLDGEVLNFWVVGINEL